MTWDNVLKLKDNRFRLDIRKEFFTTREMRYWNKLPREAVDASSLEIFKTKFIGTLKNLVELFHGGKCFCRWQWGWN